MCKLQFKRLDGHLTSHINIHADASTRNLSGIF